MLEPVARPEDRVLRPPRAVGGGGDEGAPGRQLLVGVADGEAALVVLAHLDPGVGAGAPVAEARHVHREHVAGGLALHHPLREREADAAALAEARHHRAGAPVAGQPRHRADERVAVRGEGEGAVDDALDAGVLQAGVAPERDVQLVAHALRLVGEQLVPEVPGGGVGLPRLAGLLVDAEHQPAPFLAQVALARRVHDVGQLLLALVDLGDVLAHEVLVLHRLAREPDPRHRSYLARPEPGRVDHVLRDQGALLGDHLPLAARLRMELEHPVPQVDLGAVGARRLRVRLRGAGGVEVAVQRVVEGAEHALHVGDGGERSDLRGADDLGVEPHVAVLGALRAQEVEALPGGGDGNAAHVVQAAGLAGQRLQLAVEGDGVALQRGHVGVRVEGVEAARGMPGRARGELGALDEHHVAPARAGEVVEHAAPDHAAADHRDPDVGLHALSTPPQGQRSPRLKVIASKGRMLTGSSSFALAISSHCSSWSSNASRVRSAGSTSHRQGTPSRA